MLAYGSVRVGFYNWHDIDHSDIKCWILRQRKREAFGLKSTSPTARLLQSQWLCTKIGWAYIVALDSSASSHGDSNSVQPSKNCNGCWINSTRLIVDPCLLLMNTAQVWLSFICWETLLKWRTWRRYWLVDNCLQGIVTANNSTSIELSQTRL
jgi:hypothetical protein